MPAEIIFKILQKVGASSVTLRLLLNSVGLVKKQLVCPIFVKDDGRKRSEIPSMPGLSILPIHEAIQNIRRLIDLGISSVIILGVPTRRDAVGSHAWDNNGVVQKTVKQLKMEFGETLRIITDVCLCQYNLSGHCGILVDKTDHVDNDKTVISLRKIALSHAEAGVDVVAPSSMMDGQVCSIRQSLDDHGYNQIKIFSSTKYYSSLYSPFRSVTFSKRIHDYNSINKASYQLAYANRRQSLIKVETDIREGADMVIIKPASMYLDMITMIKENFAIPICAQDTSGEYAMIASATANKWINEAEWKVSSIYAMKRAGADNIISYFCKDIASILDS